MSHNLCEKTKNEMNYNLYCLFNRKLILHMYLNGKWLKPTENVKHTLNV